MPPKTPTPSSKRDHAALAAQYVADVLSGAVPAGPWVRKAAQRHLDDLARTDGLFRFDPEKGARVCRYVELLPHTKGKWAAKRELIVLQPWQCFLVVVGFGWLKVSDGMRRFRTFYWEIPRKNGKALAVDTPIATPQGWKAHGDLVPGDFVFGPSGAPVRVEAVTPHYDGPCMRVSVGGCHIVAHVAHEWVTERSGGRPVETKDLRGALPDYIPIRTKSPIADRHEITAVEPMIGHRTVNCIQVEGGLYLAGESFVTTHNSLLAGGIGNYMFTSDGEFGAEVYSGATTEKQAFEVFTPAKLMLERKPEFAARLGVQVCAKTMIIPKNGSKFEPVIGNPGDGASPSCAIVDEFHEHDTPALYDTMETGMGSREQPLLLAITTAGTNIAGPCHDLHDDVRKILDNVVENDDLFGVIFSCDDGDDWASPASLIKANPNYGVSVKEEFLLSQQRQALHSPVKQAIFKTKHLNVWTSVMSGAFNMQLWTLGADRLMSIEEFKGTECWFGVDLASKSDLCALQVIFKKTINGLPHYYWFAYYWLPEAAIEEEGPNKASYVKWREMGLLTQTDGATVDFARITEEVLSLAKILNPVEIVYDPFNATQMAQAFMEKNIEVVEFIQQPQNFAVPMDEVSTALRDGRLHHDGNEMTAWCMSNVVAKPAKKGMFSPVKSKPAQKIDGAIAGIIATSRACLTPEPKAEARVRWI